MKNFFAALICGAVLLSSLLCLATVDAGKIALGSLYPGMSADDLINACGQPTYRDGDDWTYQNFTVEVERGIVEKISTRSETLMAAGGVRVGQAADALNSTYGKADNVDYDDGGVEYEYYSGDRSKKIEFTVMNGVISKISCSIRD